jgi:predicted nuclease with TOPRIM domain
MTEFEKIRSLSYLKLGLVLLTTLIFFAFGSWKLIAEEMYTHITIERYHQDNESITEAFKEKVALNRHLTKELAEHRIKIEVQEEMLEKHKVELTTKQDGIRKLESNYYVLQRKFKKVQHEKDSLIALISALRRAE